MSGTKELFQRSKQIRGHLVTTLVLQWLGGVLILAQAYLLAQMVDRLFLQGGVLTWDSPVIYLFIAAVLLRFTLQGLGQWAAQKGAQRLKETLRLELWRSLTSSSRKTLTPEAESALSLIHDAVEKIELFYSRYLPQLMLAVFLPLTILIFVFPIDLLTGFVFLLTAPLIPLLMMLIGKWANALVHEQWRSLQRLAHFFEDFLRGLTTIKIFDRARHQLHYIGRVTEEYRQTTMGVLRIAFLSALSLELLATLSTAIVAVEIGLRLLYGGIDFHKAFFILLLAPEFYMPLRNLATHFHSGKESAEAAESLRPFLQKDEQVDGTDSSLPVDSLTEKNRQGELVQGQDILSLHDVSYLYPGSERGVREVSLTLAEGERLALIGASGSGKSTLINIILGFLAPGEGEILLQGRRVTENTLDWARSHMAWLPQRPHFWHESIFENLRLARPEVKKEDMDWALAQVGMLEAVQDLPQGLDTSMGERGARFSMGQLQRLSLARAMLKGAGLWIMDEPVAYLDEANLEQIESMLLRLPQDKTLLVIAHNLSFVRKFDRIAVLEEGYLKAQGTHHELLQQSPLYVKLQEMTSVRGLYVD